MRETNASLADLPSGNPRSGSGKADEEVHTVNTGRRVVLDSEIDVLVNTETKVASLAEVLLKQLVLLDLETTLENLEGLLSTNGNVDRNFLVTTDSERSERVSGLRVNGLLSRKLFKHTSGTGETITTLTDAAVKDELVNLNLLHRILLALGRHG